MTEETLYNEYRKSDCKSFTDFLINKITELKLKLEALEGQTPWKDIKDKSELIGKLTNATEIIREVAESHNYFDILEAQKKAEAFLKE